MNRVKKDYNDLASQNPQLALQWNYKKNIGVTPSDVAINSNKKYWWICEKGHEWEANVNSRNRGNGCPVCSNRIILKGYNDLASQNPELADEWNYERNTKSPEEVCYKSNDRFWWKCKTCHNEWQTSLYDRYKGTGCPYCSGRRPVKGINDIATTNPELIPEWDIEKNKNLTPYDVSAGSSRKVWWKCKFGHEWRTLVSVRAKYYTGCPTCAKNLKTSFPEQALYYYISKLFSDAVNGYKELGRELDIYIPSISVAIEYDGWVWHNLKSSVRNDELKNRICRENGIKLIRIREEGCIELEEDDNVLTVRCKANDNSSLEEGIKEILKILNVSSDIDIEKDRNNIMEQYLTAYRNNSLEYRYPEVAKEWNYEKNGNITPDMVNAKTSKEFWWICPKGHEYEAPIANRTSRNLGCPYCSGHRVIVGETDLATINPALAKEWHPTKNGELIPQSIKPYSSIKIWWMGKCGHEWIAPASDRMAGNGCPYCANQKVLKGFNDFESTFPELAEEWDYKKNNGLKPSEFTKKTNKKVWWICRNGHSWSARIDFRARGGRCPYCSKKKVISGENDLATVSPRLAEEWNYEKNKNIKPQEFFPNSNKKVWWICKNGHEWESTIVNRFKGNGCPYCFGLFTITGENDLATEHPEVAKLWDYNKNDTKPDQYKSSSGKYVWWVCDEGHSWNNRIQMQVRAKGCPYCMNKKFLKGFNDLETKRPDIAGEWHPTKNSFSPQDVLVCKYIKVWWLGKCGHEWEAYINQRTNIKSPTGCPYCAGKKVLEGFNDLKTLRPEIAEEWDYEKNELQPTEVTVGSAKLIWWKCKNGHSWQQQIAFRTSKKANPICPVCKKMKNDTEQA